MRRPKRCGSGRRFGRGDPEQAELDGALGTLDVTVKGRQPDVELARVVDLVGGMASD